MTRALCTLALLVTTGCIREEIDYWGVASAEVPLVEQAREGCGFMDYAEAYDVGVDAIEARKPRPFAWRGTTAAFGAFDTFAPTQPDGDQIAALSERLWGFWAPAPGQADVQPFEVGEPGPGGPVAGGALGLVCTTGGNHLVAFDGGGPAFLAEETTWYGQGPVVFEGSCDGTSSIGPDGPTLGLLVDWTAGAAWQITLAPVPTATPLTDPLPAVVAQDVVYVERVAGQIAAVTARGDGAGGTALGYATAGASEATSIDGDPLPSPAWRGADGDLRVATTYGLYRWIPGSSPELIQAAPTVPVDAAWAITAGAGALLAVEVVSNEAEPSLDVPVAAAVAVAHDGGWALQEVPTTPCADGELCRNYGESRIVGVAGPATTPVLLYDVWRWDADETHETYACPP